MPNQTIMFIGAGREQCLGIETARNMGLTVFVTDGNPDADGFSMADNYAVASTYDTQATYEAAIDYIDSGGAVDGVMTMAADVPYTTAFVASKLGLPGIAIASAEMAADKVLMKQAFLRHQVPMPLFKEVSSPAALAAAARELGGNIVVKPADSRGARGVQRVDRPESIVEAFNVARSYSTTRRVLAEQYLAGPQLSTEGIMLDGKAYVPAIFDRNYEYLEKYAPFIVENGGEMPSIYSQTHGEAIHNVMQRAALALGIENGIIKGDLVIHDNQVKIIELAARLSGGFFGTVATPVSCGVDLVGINIRLSLGEKIAPEEMMPKFGRAAAIRFSFPQCGRIYNISGLERVSEDPACRFVHVFARQGDFLKPITNHVERPAVVVAEGIDRASAVDNARRLIDMIGWQISPSDRKRE